MSVCNHKIIVVIAWIVSLIFFFQAEDGIRDRTVTGVQTCALPIYTLAVLPPFRRTPRVCRKWIRLSLRQTLAASVVEPFSTRRWPKSWRISLCLLLQLGLVL